MVVHGTTRVGDYYDYCGRGKGKEREGWTSRGKRRRQGRASAQVEQQRQSYLEVDRQDLYICLFKSQPFSHALWDGITMSNVMLGKLCHLSEHLPFHLKG